MIFCTYLSGHGHNFCCGSLCVILEKKCFGEYSLSLVLISQRDALPYCHAEMEEVPQLVIVYWAINEYVGHPKWSHLVIEDTRTRIVWSQTYLLHEETIP